MSELRRDPIRGHWSIIAPERGRKPNDFLKKVATQQAAGTCPFCPDHEAETPPELLAVRQNDSAANTPGWSVRIVPNLYAVVRPEVKPGLLEVPGMEGLYRNCEGFGVHDTIISTPDHAQRPWQFSVDHWDRLLALIQHRMHELWARKRVKHVALYENQGPMAGASRSHAHMQLLALPLVPPLVESVLATAKQHRERHDVCLFCDYMRREIEDGLRVVSADLAYATLAPYASRVPYELIVLPRAHRSSFDAVPNGERRRLAVHLREVLQRLATQVPDVSYNMVLHSTASTDQDASSSFHWHLELLPRIGELAGLELGSGAYLNWKPPEQAASELRAVDL